MSSALSLVWLLGLSTGVFSQVFEAATLWEQPWRPYSTSPPYFSRSEESRTPEIAYPPFIDFGKHQDSSSINSLLLSGYFDFYGLNDIEYDFAFLERTLKRIVRDANEFDVDHYYEKLNLLSNYTYLKYNGDIAPFQFLAQEVLMRSNGTIFEDLVRFNVANALSKQILYYLALKMDLREGGNVYSDRQPRMLRIAMEQLEKSITRAYAPYYVVRKFMKKLHTRGRIYSKIYAEEKWIEEQIHSAMHSIKASYDN